MPIDSCEVTDDLAPQHPLEAKISGAWKHMMWLVVGWASKPSTGKDQVAYKADPFLRRYMIRASLLCSTISAQAQVQNPSARHPPLTAAAENPLGSFPGRPSHPYFLQEHEHQLRMVRPSTSLVGAPDVPKGYELRQYRPDDEGEYKDLFNLGFTGDVLEQTRAKAIPKGFFVIEHPASGHLVASCVAQLDSWGDEQERGILGWLIVDPSHAGLGLGTIVAARVTNRLTEERFGAPGLGTEDFRLAAISIYLEFGWRPYLYGEEMDRRWRETYERLGRQFLREQCVEP